MMSYLQDTLKPEHCVHFMNFIFYDMYVLCLKKNKKSTREQLFVANTLQANVNISLDLLCLRILSAFALANKQNKQKNDLLPKNKGPNMDICLLQNEEKQKKSILVDKIAMK